VSALNSIRTKVIVGTVAVALLAAGPALWFAASRTSTMADKAGRDDAQDLAEIEAAKVRDHLGRLQSGEESAATAAELSHQAEALQALVETFHRTKAEPVGADIR